MKILITGGGGQLGMDCSQVLATEHTIHACSSAQLDITRPQQVTEVLQAAEPDVVINCAAYTAVDGCEEDRRHCMEINGAGPGILARECAGRDCRLIHISTDYVFNGSKPVPRPYTEDDPTDPMSVYGKSKLAGEEAVRSNLDNHLILRTAWLYGASGGNFLKTMLRLAVSDPGRTVRIVNDQFGSLTWSWRLAKQIEQLLAHSLTGTLHATATGYSTWYTGAKFFLDAMEVDYSLQPCTTEEYPVPALRPTNSILENSRLQKKGLDIMAPWEEDVKIFARQFRPQLLAEAHG